MSELEKSVTLTSKDLKEIIAGAVEIAIKESKKPSVLEQRQLDAEAARIKEANDTRKDTAAQIKEEMANKAFQKRVCAHKGGRPEHPHTVYVSDEIGGYVLCQKCQAVIRPDNQLVHFPGDFAKKRTDVIFDTLLFNRLFQECNNNGFIA